MPVASLWEAHTATLVPDDMFGRVGATTSFAAHSLTLAGALLAGTLADQFGAGQQDSVPNLRRDRALRSFPQ